VLVVAVVSLREVVLVLAAVASLREVVAVCAADVWLVLAAVASLREVLLVLAVTVVSLREVAAVCSAVVVLVLAAVVVLREVVLAVARSSREVVLAVSSREVLAVYVPAGMDEESPLVAALVVIALLVLVEFEVLVIGLLSPFVSADPLLAPSCQRLR